MQRRGCKHLKMKLEQGGQVLGEICPIVTAGIEMEFVRDATRLEQLVQRLGASVETIVILRAAIKVNVQSGKIRGAGDRKRVVLFPEGGIDRRTENVAKNSYPGEPVGIHGVDDRKFLDQSRAKRSNRSENAGMTKRQMQCAIAAHGNPGNAAGRPFWSRAIALFEKGQKFLQEKILITLLSVA